jgi:hypothetical protein
MSPACPESVSQYIVPIFFTVMLRIQCSFISDHTVSGQLRAATRQDARCTENGRKWCSNWCNLVDVKSGRTTQTSLKRLLTRSAAPTLASSSEVPNSFSEPVNHTMHITPARPFNFADPANLRQTTAESMRLDLARR